VKKDYCKACKCIDPKNQGGKPNKPTCKLPQYKGDGNCDDENNNKGCGYDGGDCCAKTVKGGKVKKDYCKKCACLDPKAKCPKNMINPFACKCGTEKTTTDAGCPQLKCKPCIADGGKTAPPKKTTPKFCICHKMYQPVCGADGKTYGNSCQAKCKNVKYTNGACGSKGCTCAEIFKPVCGSDGKTYGNSCKAKCKQVKYKDGACSSKGNCEKLGYQDCEKTNKGQTCSWDGGECKTKATKPKCPKNMINPSACKCGYVKTTTDAGCPQVKCKPCIADGMKLGGR